MRCGVFRLLRAAQSAGRIRASLEEAAPDSALPQALAQHAFPARERAASSTQLYTARARQTSPAGSRLTVAVGLGTLAALPCVPDRMGFMECHRSFRGS